MRFLSSALFFLATATTTMAVAAETTSRSLQTAPQCLAPERTFDFPGNDLFNQQPTSVEGCCSLCSSNPFCHAYTWTKYLGGSCYLKTKKSTSEPKGLDTDGTAYFVSGEVYKCQPVQLNRDLAGTDFKNVTASRPEGCCAECRLSSGCTGFAWNALNGGTCYLKSGPLLRVAMANVYAAQV